MVAAPRLTAGADDGASRDAANARFWDDLCGSGLARKLGIRDASPAALGRFDRAYLEFYPYLTRHLPLAAVRGKDVLEVGLGYGTVSELLAREGARYHGLDIAAAPVAMANHRLRSAGLPGSARQGSILAAPFPDAAFDFVVAIGCFHHTGDVEGAIREAYRLLRPGGSLIFMVYNLYSYRRWLTAPLSTLGALIDDRRGVRRAREGSAAQRRAYDVDGHGDAAPVTEWVSIRELRRMCAPFSAFEATLENVAAAGALRIFRRETLLRSWLARQAGLDVYATAVR